MNLPKYFAALAILCALPCARGAEGDPRIDVTGAAGFGTWAGIGHNVTMGSGLSAAGSVGYRLTRRLWLEAEYAIFRMNGRVTHSTPPTATQPLGSYETPYRAKGSQTSINCLLQASKGRAREYVLFGVSVQSFRQEEPPEYKVVGSGELVQRQDARIGPAINLGAGVKIRLAPHLFLRPEGRVHMGGETSGLTDLPLLQARFTVGFGYAW